MTRKKFIKILMSEGMSRNDAADCAALAQEAGRPYLLVSGDLLCFHRQHFGDPLGWIKMRYSIIHGHNSPAGRFFAAIDEAHEHKDQNVYAAMVAGTSARPRPVVIITPASGMIGGVDLSNWWKVPQPAAGYLCAELPVPEKRHDDPLDALTYAIEAQRTRYAGGAMA